MHSPHETHDDSPMGKLLIEGDAGLVSLAAARQHPVVPDVVAAANAAVAEDAGFMIDRDDGGGIVLAARSGAVRETRLLDAGRAGEGFQFAVSRLLLARAGRRMVRHQQLDQSAARACTGSVGVLTVMPGSTWRMQDAAIHAPPISTTQTRHTPTGFSFCWWQRVGMGMPFRRAASKMVVPAERRKPAGRQS